MLARTTASRPPATERLLKNTEGRRRGPPLVILESGERPRDCCRQDALKQPDGTRPSRHVNGLAQPAAKRGGVHRAGAMRRDLAGLENDQGRDAANAIASGDLALPIGVKLQEAELGLHLAGHAFIGRGHHLAWTAPLRPEVD